MSRCQHSNHKIQLKATLAILVLFLSPLLLLNEAYAMGSNPSSCNNRYDGPITSAKIVVGKRTYDPIANPGLTFVLSNARSYDVVFVIHTQAQSSQGNSESGTTWYRHTSLGFANGVCVDSAGPESDIKVTTHNTHPANLAPETKQSVQYGTLTSGFSFNVKWVNPR